jgi:hypothetical protein
MDQRRFQRIKFAAPGLLRHEGMTYRVRLENISLRGALLSSDECLVIPEGDTCTLTIKLEAEDYLLVVTVKTVHSFFSMIGVHFSNFENDGEYRLSELIQRITCEPEQLSRPWQEFLAHGSQAH